MDIKEHLQKFMFQQSGVTVTPLLEHGLVAATGEGSMWSLTEAGHTLLETQDTEVEHSEHYWEKDRNGPRILPGALSEQCGGDHYKNFPIQPAEFIEKNHIHFLDGCVIKRMCRHEAKAGVEDLRKAIHEIRLIMELRYGVSE